MMPELDEMIEHLRRITRQPTAAVKPWYDVQAKTGTRKAEIRIYDEIGWWGTSAKSFADELAGLDVDEISLRLNSPGGGAWDGIAIYNALRAHPATVTVTIDGLAASAASVIAMAGQRLLMNRGSQLMIHDAWVVAIGNADDLARAGAIVEKLSASMADIYAARAGGTASEWRAAMTAETWYTADEAVESGLADALADDHADSDAQSRFDLAMYAFAHAGRAAAPPPAITARRPAATPKPPAAPATGTARQEGAGQMDPAKIREALGLTASAPDDEVKAALVTAGLATAAAPPPAPEPDDDAETDTPAPKAKPKAKPTAGVMNIDASVWEETQTRMKALEAQAARQAREDRDKVIAQAVSDGKFAPARKGHWAKLWDNDPEGTRDTIGQLAKNVVPLSALGYDLDAGAENDEAYSDLFSTSRKGA
jgi:ATP-dependent protease ClpP protease subunit